MLAAGCSSTADHGATVERADDEGVAFERVERARPKDPEARVPAQRSAPEPKNALVVRVASDGTIHVDGNQILDDQIDNLFRAAFTRDANTQIVFEVDKNVRHGRVVQLMERAKAAGLTRLAIGTGRS